MSLEQANLRLRWAEEVNAEFLEGIPGGWSKKRAAMRQIPQHAQKAPRPVGVGAVGTVLERLPATWSGEALAWTHIHWARQTHPAGPQHKHGSQHAHLFHHNWLSPPCCQDLLHCDLWAFENIPLRVFRWSWLSCGLVSKAQLAQTLGVTEAQLESDHAEGLADACALEELTCAPAPMPSATCSAPDPQPGERTHSWLVQASADGAPEEWHELPRFMWHSIDRELNNHAFIAAGNAPKRRRQAEPQEWGHER